MAGHSKFKNIMHRKGAQDAKRAKVFTRLGKELSVAVKAGVDPDGNPRLRSAIAACRAANMPKDNIEKVLKKAETGDGSEYSEIRYEGFGANGTALIVETLTDNKNRTASEVRSAFTKFNGNLGENGSVTYLFENIGQLIFSSSVADEEGILEVAIEFGAEDIISNEFSHEIITSIDSFNEIRESLSEKYGDPQEAGLVWKPKSIIDISETNASTLLKLLNALDDCEDVQNVFTNFEIPDDIINNLNE